MTATRSLRMRADECADEVFDKIKDRGGQVSGTITDIRRELEVDGLNNLVRESLGILCEDGRLSGTPLDSISLNLPSKMYLYKVNAEHVLLERLANGMIDRCGTAADIIAFLGIEGAVSPQEFDAIIKRLIGEKVVVAPIAVHASFTSKLVLDAYLYLALR